MWSLKSDPHQFRTQLMDGWLGVGTWIAVGCPPGCSRVVSKTEEISLKRRTVTGGRVERLGGLTGLRISYYEHEFVSPFDVGNLAAIRRISYSVYIVIGTAQDGRGASVDRNSRKSRIFSLSEE